jgi:hypothetical protein
LSGELSYTLSLRYDLTNIDPGAHRVLSRGVTYTVTEPMYVTVTSESHMPVLSTYQNITDELTRLPLRGYYDAESNIS